MTVNFQSFVLVGALVLVDGKSLLRGLRVSCTYNCICVTQVYYHNLSAVKNIFFTVFISQLELW